MKELTQLESEVLKMLLAGSHPVLEKLRLQSGKLAVQSRKFTGVGFFTQFMLNEAEPLGRAHFNFGDVAARINGLQNGAGFVLFIEDGRLKTLEGYTYDEPWPNAVGQFSLEYVGGKRDWKNLDKKLAVADDGHEVERG